GGILAGHRDCLKPVSDTDPRRREHSYLPWSLYIMYIRYIRAGAMSVTELHYNTVTEARAHFSALIDAAEAGVPGTVRRDKRRAAIVDADRLRRFLIGVRPARAEVIAEGGGGGILLPGLPIPAAGRTLKQALD